MYKKILHATDLNEHHFEYCERALAIAKHFKATLHLLHVIESPFSLQIAQGLGFAEIEQPDVPGASLVLKSLGEALNIPAEQQWVSVGDLPSHLFQKARDLHCSLIIIGKTKHPIVEHANCDILVLS